MPAQPLTCLAERPLRTRLGNSILFWSLSRKCSGPVRLSHCALRVDYWVGGLALCVKLGGQMFIDRLAMADGDEAYYPRLAVDRVDNSKAANAILPQAVEFAHERLPTLRIGRNATNSRLDGAF